MGEKGLVINTKGHLAVIQNDKNRSLWTMSLACLAGMKKKK